MYYSKDIVMTGYVADYGAAIIARHFYDELIDKLPVSVVKRSMGYYDNERRPEDYGDIQGFTDCIWKVSEGGVFKALHDMAAGINTGISVWLDRISIRQETVEICEVYGINPYMLNATGNVLIVSEHGNELVRILQMKGIYASVIGYTTDNNDKIIINDDEIRYLESRITDELHKLKIKEMQ